MPRSGNRRCHLALAVLLVVAGFALTGHQWADESTPGPDTTTSVAFAALPASTGPRMMNGVISPAGQFEELVKPTPVPTLAPPATPVSIAVAPTPARETPVFESGIASTYGTGDGFEGNRTACGQVFHTAIVQVAHKTLPCGTVLRIEDSGTGRSVEAAVTDRGPYIPGRIVDLSWAAFRQLDSTGPGLLRVNIYVLEG